MLIVSEKSKTTVAALVLLLSIGDLVFSINTVWNFTTDDAYISWYYASQLVNGQGLHWHAQLPVVEGYSNFLWVLLSALIIQLKWTLVLSIKIISCVCLALALYFLYRLSRLFLNRLMATVPIFIFSHYIGVSWWAVSGMETMLYTCLSVLFVWQCCLAFGFKQCEQNNTLETLQCHSTFSWALCNIVLLLLSLTRFEGLIWVLPLLLFIACQGIKNPKLLSAINRKKLRQWFAISLFCFLLPYMGYFAWRISYFGHWIPNSFSCKTLTEGQLFVVDFDFLQVIFPLLVISTPYLFSKQKDCRHLMLWLPTVLYGVMLIDAHPVIAYFSRLFMASWAVFCLLPVLGLVYFIKQHFKEKDLDLAAALVLVLLTWGFIPGSEGRYLSIKLADYEERNQSRMDIAHLLNKKSKAGASVYLGDCGIIPYYARRDIRFIDAQCLNNSDLTSSPYKENTKLYAKYLMDKVKPDWLIINYYPEESHGDYLSDILFEYGFYNNYQLISTFQSGYLMPQLSGAKTKIVDFVYQVYKRQY